MIELEKYPLYVDGECQGGNAFIPTEYNHYEDGTPCGGNCMDDFNWEEL